MADGLQRLESWYRSQCDGEWEHGFGITIETHDNPGWGLKIDLQGTGLESAPFTAISRYFERQDDYLTCRIEVMEGRPYFRGSCYIGRLGRVDEFDFVAF